MTRAATIDDVKHWAVEGGIGHILNGAESVDLDRASYRWGRWLCGTLSMGGETTATPPRRKCRRCMARLAKATVTTEAAA